MDINRIEVEQARRHVSSGQALLVCAYEDEAKCRGFGLEGSISLAELQAHLPILPRSQELIFWCD